MPPRLLALAVLALLGLISVNAAAVEPGAQIPFRYARPPSQNRDRGGTQERERRFAMGYAHGGRE